MAKTSGTHRTFARSIDAAGWALFFIWAGVALIAGFSWTVSLIGTALIILSVQAILFFRRESLDVFMAAVGVALLVGAIADIYTSIWSFFPALLIVVGIAMLVDSFRRRPGGEEITGVQSFPPASD